MKLKDFSILTKENVFLRVVAVGYGLVFAGYIKSKMPDEFYDMDILAIKSTKSRSHVLGYECEVSFIDWLLVSDKL